MTTSVSWSTVSHNLTLLQHQSERGADFRLHRLIEWAGLDHTRLHIATCNDLTYDAGPNRVILAMGQGAMEVTTGVRRLIGDARGYVYPGTLDQQVVPTVHPAFIARGNARWSAAFINDLQKASTVAASGVPPQITTYALDPSPMEAYRWAQEYMLHLRSNPAVRLAFDIETPGKGEDEDDVDLGDAPDRTWNIDRIGFSYAPLTALSVPWAPEYMSAIRVCLGSPGEKVVWNAGFDVPRVKRAGVPAAGLIHDGMVAWHILHTDLPKKLSFVATFVCPWQPAWKHLSGARPAFYNATDADVEYRAMEEIERELRRASLWDVYQHDVVDLEPILVHMQTMGMPVDPDIRLDRAIKLDVLQREIKAKLEALIPLAARKIDKVFKKVPQDVSGLLSRPVQVTVPHCSVCMTPKPKKDHFKTYKKKVNPCAGAMIVEVTELGTEWYRLGSFSPSREQLTRYHASIDRPLPMVWDKRTRARKVSFGEKQLKTLILRHRDDILYPLVLDYRAVDRLAGTYVGRPLED